MLPAGFESLIQQYQSPYQASAYQQPGVGPFDGLPIPGGVLGEVGFQMLVAPQIQGMMATNGYIPGGFRGHQNLYDRQRAIAAQNQRQAVINNAAKMEQYHLRDTIGGVNRLFDMGMNESTIQASAANAAAMAPMMAQMAPGMLSQLGGRNGSPTLMAMRMLESPDRIDPVTGRSGMTTESMNELTSNLYNDMFLAGDPFARKNVKAEDMGAIYAQLSRSGMLAPPSGNRRQRGMDAYRELARSSPEMAAKIRADAGLGEDSAEIEPESFSDEQIDNMMRTKSLQRVVRSKDTAQVKQALDSYKEMTSAMKDIFGANGETDAPMPKVWAALEALTGGMSAVKNKDGMATKIRTIGELAKQSGVGLDELGMMNQQIGQKLANSALPAALQTQMLSDRLADRRAYDLAGIGAGAGLGSMTKEETLSYQEDMRIAGAQSSEARNLAAVLNVAETAPGANQSPAVKALQRAVQAGKTTFSYLGADGKRVTTNTLEFSNSGFAQRFMEEQQGQSAGQANSALQDSRGIERQLVSKNISGVLAESQREEQRTAIANDVVNKSAYDVGQLAKLDEKESLQAAALFNKARTAALQKAIANDTTIIDGTPENNKKLQELQVAAIQATLESSENPAMQKIKAELATKSKQEADREVGNIVASQNRNADTVAREQIGLKSETDLAALSSKKFLDLRKDSEAKAKQDGAAAKLVSGIGAAAVVERLVTAVQEVGGDLYNKDGTFSKEAGDIAFKGLGANKQSVVANAVNARVVEAAQTKRDLATVDKELEQLEEDAADDMSDEQQAEYYKKADQLTKRKTELKETLAEQQQIIEVFIPKDGKPVAARADAEDYKKHAKDFETYGEEARQYKQGYLDSGVWSRRLYDATLDERKKMLTEGKGAEAMRSARAEHAAAGEMLESITQDSELKKQLTPESKTQLDQLNVAQAKLDSLANDYAEGNAGQLMLGAFRPYDKARDEEEYKSEAGYRAGVKARVDALRKTRADLLPKLSKAAAEAAEVTAGSEQLDPFEQTAINNYGKQLNIIDELETKTNLSNTEVRRDKQGEYVVADLTDKDGKMIGAGIRLDSQGNTALEKTSITKEQRNKLIQAAFERDRAGIAVSDIAKGLNPEQAQQINDLEKQTGLKNTEIILDNNQEIVVADRTDKNGVTTKGVRLDAMSDIPQAQRDELTDAAIKLNRRTDQLVKDGRAEAEEEETRTKAKETAFRRQTHVLPATDADVERVFGVDLKEELKSKADREKSGLNQTDLAKTVAQQRNVLATGEHYADPTDAVDDKKRTLAEAELNAKNLYEELGGDKLNTSKLATIAKEKEISEDDLRQFREDYKAVQPIYELRTKGSQQYNDAMLVPDPMAAERSAGKETASNQATQAAQPQAVASTTTGNTSPVAISGNLSINLETGMGRLNGSMPNSAA